MSNSSRSSFVGTVRHTMRHEWLWIGMVSVVVSLVVIVSLYSADPRFHEVWQYTPAAIPTLSFVESVMHQAPVMVPGNHATWLSVWLLQHVIATPKWIVIIVYVMATIATAISAYVVFRARAIAVALAIFGAVAFAILPARFVQPSLAYQWWVIMPMVVWWGITWWDSSRPYIDWGWVSVTIIVFAMSGDTLWFWSTLVLFTFAVIAALMHRTLQAVMSATAIGVISFGVMYVCYLVWPMPMMDSDAGIRLSGLWIPLADHRATMLGQFGRDFAALDVVHTDIAYIGVCALIGLGIAVVHTLMRSIGAQPATHVNRLLLVTGVLVVIANQRGIALVTQFFGLPMLSSMLVDVWLAFIGIIVLVMTLQTRVVTWWLVGVLTIAVIVDHLPRTNMMDQMMQRPMLVTTRSWRDGIWFGQQQQAVDVVSLSGLGDIEPGFGRWSDADIADHVAVALATPITQPVTLEIRARGVGVNIGAPIIIQIGNEQQSVVLTETVATYQLTFLRGSGDVITIYPQPVTTPPPGDSRRIGVFVQSIRVVTP